MKDFGNCGAVRKAAGKTNFPHSSHEMSGKLTGKFPFVRFCTHCNGTMWGVPDDWEHDVILERECKMPDHSKAVMERLRKTYPEFG